MKRKIITIDENLCNGCGICADACHEGAIGMVNGKAKLLREDYCDGLGDCLPACPTNAISFEEREAPAYDHAAVTKSRLEKGLPPLPDRTAAAGGCPGSNAHKIEKPQRSVSEASVTTSSPVSNESQLRQWPVQIKLVPVNAPYFENANLLIAADCCAYSYGDFHGRFMKNKITLIGCPKLDSVDYSEKLTAIIKENNIKSVTVVRMEVPCCAGIAAATQKAIAQSGKMIPWHIVTLSTDGNILEE